MKASYREMFDEVRASKRLNEEVLNMTKQERTQVVKKVSISFIIAAALAVLLAGTALAAAIGVPETLQEWFEKQWTESGGGEDMPQEQAAVIESLVQPVGAAVTDNGITVTLDSVTPGENVLWLMLKFQGEKLVDRWDFRDSDLVGGPMEKEVIDGPTLHGMLIKDVGVLEDGTQVQLWMWQAPKGVNFLEGGEMELRLDGIVLLGRAPEPGTEGSKHFEELEGTWTLPFTLKPVTNQSGLTAKSARVSGTHTEWKEVKGETIPTESKKTFTIQNIRVTSTGYSYVRPKDSVGFGVDAPTLQMADDMTVMGYGSGPITPVEQEIKEVHGYWEFPVDLSKVESIQFGDVVVPLKQAKK
ncbi:DUF4179 domain-containing protein [uncultured Oscillibacter sp.]|uniref:DUF4179 domain-containing protein n=1 Tax=uncultured Oscillibacter sp. TaxID=876091 RepID=UPI0025D64AE6|nr:DUF4179 domain-containing protein [uncultured Oscillibacter sp.]